MNDIESDIRMVFFVRTDLKMPKGKIAAQVGHAVQYLVEEALAEFNPGFLYRSWSGGIATKICLKVSSEEELEEFYNLGIELNFPCTKVIDKGLTCFNRQETPTVVGWGPLEKSAHYGLTERLKLL